LNGLDYLQLRLIEEALDRLGSGHYGICLACDLPIPTKRLEAVPWTRYCLQCQEEIGSNPEAGNEELRPRLTGSPKPAP
jgi:DnaK suppressor protein